ncbi:MAG: DUF5716 family protein [Roseburia sp.]|nr:DUF5716 family protein [Roseburia sp.]
MFIERALDELTKKNKVVIGFDLGAARSQISYCRADQSMPDTLSLVMGEEQYNIPTLLCRRADGNGAPTWLAGRDALRAIEEKQGVAVENLLEPVLENASVQVGEETFEAEYLLEVYIRKTLAILSAYVRTDAIGAIAFTMEAPEPVLMDAVRAIVRRVCAAGTEVYFLSHEDCFFQYIIHQPSEMWIHDVLLYDYGKDGITSHILQMNRKTSPVACFMETERFPQMRVPDTAGGLEIEKEAFYRKLDVLLLEILQKQCGERVVTSIFLLGDFFSKEWCKESLKYMCKSRRVFQGNNLFSKGACYGARERLYPSTLSTSYVYLSPEKLRANIGMECDRGQEAVYLPILNAGTSWYDAKKEFDVMLVRNNVITLTITPVDGSKTRVAQISLEGLPVRGNKTNRVGLRFYMENPEAVYIEIWDKGFGEIFPSTGKMWKECLPLEAIS